jgi:hypothetical protein
MHIETDENSSEASFSLFPIGFVGGGPFSDHYGAPKSSQMTDAWLCAKEQFVRSGGDVCVLTTQASHWQYVKDVSAVG